MNEKCRGCVALENGQILECFPIREGYSDNCPCRECLVKVTCTKECEEFDTFAEGTPYEPRM